MSRNLLRVKHGRLHAALLAVALPLLAGCTSADKTTDAARAAATTALSVSVVPTPTPVPTATPVPPSPTPAPVLVTSPDGFKFTLSATISKSITCHGDVSPPGQICITASITVANALTDRPGDFQASMYLAAPYALGSLLFAFPASDAPSQALSPGETTPPGTPVGDTIGATMLCDNATSGIGDCVEQDHYYRIPVGGHATYDLLLEHVTESASLTDFQVITGTTIATNWNGSVVIVPMS